MSSFIPYSEYHMRKKPTHEKLSLEVEQGVAPPPSCEDDLVREVFRPIFRNHSDYVSLGVLQQLAVF